MGVRVPRRSRRCLYGGQSGRGWPNEPHAFVHPLERRHARSSGPFRAQGKNAPKVRLVRTGLSKALPYRLEELDHRLCDLKFEVPVAVPRVTPLDGLEPLARGDVEDFDEVRNSGLGAPIVPDLCTRVSYGRPDLLGYHVWWIEDQQRPELAPTGRRHLSGGVLEIHDPGTYVRDGALGNGESGAEPGIETLGDTTDELDVLSLIIADRHRVGLIEQHIGSHQHRVGEERRRNENLGLGLLLELRHAAKFAEGR